MKYVFLDEKYEFGHLLMSDLENKKNIQMIYKDKIYRDKVKNYLHRIYISKFLNKIINVPGKTNIYKKIFSNYPIDTEICVVMISAWYDTEFLKWIRNNFQNSKLILILRDTVASNETRNKLFKINNAKKEFDFVFSYDNSFDVPQYNLMYAPVYISKINTLNIPKGYNSDISFIAVAKDRLNLIHDIYTKLNNAKIDMFFWILGTKKCDQIESSKIFYAKDSLNRIECLQREIASNCILEVLKGDAHSNTLRFWEAIMYNKKFLTNWEGVKNSPYYNPQFVHYYKSAEDIDINFIKEKIEVDYGYKGELSPTHFIDLIEKKLNDEV